jgi:hypothetical protein
VAAGNRHFAIGDHALTNFARTRLIRYCSEHDSDAIVNSVVEELGPGCLSGILMKTVTFVEPSRLRLLGRRSFCCCKCLGSIRIPSAVEVIGERAFECCSLLVDVQIATDSRLRRIERDSFLQCSLLKPVDVPWRAEILEKCQVLGHVHDENGSRRTRVRFREPPFVLYWI